jgi:hypothetical protein
MRISHGTRFPHPVLSEETNDYTNGKFSVDLRVSESRITGKVTVAYSVELAEDALDELLKNEQAMLGLFIVCRRTYYNELHQIENGSGHIEFSKGELRGDVVFRPVICATREIYSFSAPNLHEEFSGVDWSFRPADVLALGTELVIDVGLDKLAPMETIFNLVEKNDVPNGETQIFLDDEKIGICADKDTCRGIHAMRGSGVGKLALLNGVYLPAVMQTLTAVAAEPGSYADRRWFAVFSAKCSHLGISLEDDEVHANAQKLLCKPLGSMLKSKEFNPS